MLILLDIDGVLVPANSWKEPEVLEDGFPAFSFKSVQSLKRILAETNAGVLLTTSHKNTYNISQWRNLLSTRGIISKKIQRLASNSLQTTRAAEILDWYHTKHTPGEEFVIIDDDKMLNALPVALRDNLVLTSPSVGLTDELADGAISILKRQSSVYQPAV